MLVVIAGAGFSKGFGLPLTDELRDYALKKCDNPEPAVLPDFLSADEYPLSEYVKPRSRIPDFEYLLTIWEDYLEQREQTGFIDGPSRRRHHRDFIENVCCHLYACGRKSLDAHEARHTATAAWLDRALDGYDVRFVTFNYDILLETVCRRAGRRFTYLSRDADSSIIPVRKLHGSINWRVHRLDEPVAGTYMELHRGNGGVICATNDLDVFGDARSSQPPVVMPPSARKNYDGVFWRTWKFALRDIADAERVLIVGYSFPPLDTFAASFLGRALSTSGGVGVSKKTISYVCPSVPDCERAKRLLGLPDDAISVACWDIDHFSNILA